MNRKTTLFTGQWADMPLEVLCKKARDFGYDGLELACWGDHFEVEKADTNYCAKKRELLKKYGLKVWSISSHLVGQCVCDLIDERHKALLPSDIWGDGDPEGVRERAAERMIETAKAASRLGVQVVNGFTGSSIWHLLYSFPAVPPQMIEDGYKDFRERWFPILWAFEKYGVRFALEVHPTEIAFDIVTARRALEASDYHPAFGFNYDPSHLAYQGVDYIQFLYEFSDRIFHVHIKDVGWREAPGPSGVFGGHLPFGDRHRYWDFRSPGRGRVDFEAIIRALNDIGYNGPLSVEWEDSGMDREFGAREACQFVKRLDFPPAQTAFDAAFERETESSK